MSLRIQLVGHEHDRQRIAAAARAHRIDAFAPDRREAVLAAERYLLSASASGRATDERLRVWRRKVKGTWMPEAWLRSLNRS